MERCWYGAEVRPNQASLVIFTKRRQPSPIQSAADFGKYGFKANQDSDFPLGMVKPVRPGAGTELAYGFHHAVDKGQEPF